MITKVLGTSARFCGESCKEGFKADREGGVMYGLHVVNNVPCMHREEFSLVACCCAYCGEQVKGKIPEQLKEKFHV